MNTSPFILIISASIFICQCQHLSCRTNCTTNPGVEDECWRDALNYRSSELIKRIFSFASLSVYVDSYRRTHSDAFNNTIEFINIALNNHLINESITANLSIELFKEANTTLLDRCRQLISTPIKSVKEYPSLSCTITTCASEIMNYMVLFIISTILCSSIFLICITNSVQMRCKPITRRNTRRNEQLINSLSTNNTNVNS